MNSDLNKEEKLEKQTVHEQINSEILCIFKNISSGYNLEGGAQHSSIQYTAQVNLVLQTTSICKHVWRVSWTLLDIVSTSAVVDCWWHMTINLGCCWLIVVLVAIIGSVVAFWTAWCSYHCRNLFKMVSCQTTCHGTWTLGCRNCETMFTILMLLL